MECKKLHEILRPEDVASLEDVLPEFKQCKSITDFVQVKDEAFPLGQRCPSCGQLINRKTFESTVETK